MTSAGFYHYYCGITAQPNDEDQYEDFGDFDIHLNLVQRELNEKEPKRQPHLETNYFHEDWLEIVLRFRVSFRDGSEDINRFIDLVTESLESHLNITIVDFDIENII
ncbi:MAG: hypothetical protein HGN29_05200 [Asgard group archaeon]|nr:hypothetical protein [Asgard group archaeon]